MSYYSRYGFNSEGQAAVFERIKAFRSKEDVNTNSGRVLGINIGKNKTSTDAVRDYLSGVQAFAASADYLVINISSPNTPGLRSLQNKSELEKLIDPVTSNHNIIH